MGQEGAIQKFMRALLIALACCLLVAGCGSEEPSGASSAEEFVDDPGVWVPLWVAYENWDAHPETNIAFPDKGVHYTGTRLTIPAGARLDFKARFPRARYMSFQSYFPSNHAQRGLPISALQDAEIVPDPGSTNPFVPGADRNSTQRSYTVHVVDAVDPGPGKRAENTLYTGAAGQAWIVYRIYLPDESTTEVTAGGGHPQVELTLEDGQVLTGEEAFAALEADNSPWPLPTMPAPILQRLLNEHYLVDVNPGGETLANAPLCSRLLAFWPGTMPTPRGTRFSDEERVPIQAPSLAAWLRT